MLKGLQLTIQRILNMSSPPSQAAVTNPLHFNYPGRVKLSTAERRALNKKKRREKKLEKKKEYLNHIDPPKTFIHAGKRCVVPYWFDYRCNTRHRWVGRNLFEVITSEFPACSEDFLKESIRNGRMKLNGKVIGEDSMNHVMEMKDVLEHRVHRHEPPVLAQDIQILPNLVESTEDIFAANKPPSMPVHPCGGYYFNSLLQILYNHPFNYPNSVQPVHRLDKLTSGVVIFSGNPRKITELFKDISERRVSKTYIALVDGILGEVGDEIIVEEPLWSDPAGRLLGKVDRENGKPSTTIFTILAQKDGKTLTKCKPITGRTHQIRIHLLHLGHPIIGDPLYQLQDIDDMEHNQFAYLQKTQPKLEDYLEDPNQSFNSEEFNPEIDPLCLSCKTPTQDIPLDRLVMCLHSILYSGEGWKFYAPPPQWAKNILSEEDIEKRIKSIPEE